MDDSCTCCGCMSMTSLRSRLSFLKGLAPSAATHTGFSGSSREPPGGALGDLKVTVRASLPGMSPRTSYSSRSERPVRFPGDFAGPSHGAPNISFGELIFINLISQPRSAPVPFIPEVQEELTKLWMTTRSRSSISSVLTTLDGGAARGYLGIPQVERAIVVHLCPRNAATWRNCPRLPSKAFKLTAALAAKA